MQDNQLSIDVWSDFSQTNPRLYSQMKYLICSFLKFMFVVEICVSLIISTHSDALFPKALPQPLSSPRALTTNRFWLSAKLSCRTFNQLPFCHKKFTSHAGVSKLETRTCLPPGLVKYRLYPPMSMASTTLIFDPDSDLFLILPRSVPPTSASTIGEQEPPRKKSKSNKSKGYDAWAIFSHGFSEGEALRIQGTAEIPLPDDDPAAMAILLDIIHTRGRRVPRKVSLTLLALLAIGIDKYQIQDASEFYADIWLNSFKDEYGDFVIDNDSDLTSQLMWLTISWIFRNPAIFNLVTANLIREDKWCMFKDETKVPGTDQVLPLPMTVLGMAAT